MYRDYAPKGVQFFYVYKQVEHPEINNYVSSFTIKERLLQAAEAKRRLKTEIPFICDSMTNEMRETFGRAPNGEYILDPQGKLIRKRFWSNAVVLRKDLVDLVGPVDKITTVKELDTRFEVEHRPHPSGVVKSVEAPGGLRPLEIKPIMKKDDKNPFFAKLRAEATGSLFGKSKTGKLMFSLNLDPLYKVHWNNRAGNVTIKLTQPDGVALSERELRFPKVEEDTDIDPRQFLVDLQLPEASPKEPIVATVEYTVCDDAETFCVTVEQQYEIPIKATRMLGSRPNAFLNGLFANVRDLDKNKDGDLTKDELPPGEVTLYIGHMDFDGNGVIEKSEIDRFLKMFNNGRGIPKESADAQGEGKNKGPE